MPGFGRGVIIHSSAMSADYAVAPWPCSKKVRTVGVSADPEQGLRNCGAIRFPADPVWGSVVGGLMNSDGLFVPAGPSRGYPVAKPEPETVSDRDEGQQARLVTKICHTLEAYVPLMRGRVEIAAPRKSLSGAGQLRAVSRTMEIASCHSCKPSSRRNSIMATTCRVQRLCRVGTSKWVEQIVEPWPRRVLCRGCGHGGHGFVGVIHGRMTEVIGGMAGRRRGDAPVDASLKLRSRSRYVCPIVGIR